MSDKPKLSAAEAETTIRAALESGKSLCDASCVEKIALYDAALSALTAMQEEIALWRRVSLDLYEASAEEREAARQQFRDACEGEDIRCRRCAAMQEETAKLRDELEFAEGQRSELDDLLRLSNQQRRAIQEERESRLWLICFEDSCMCPEVFGGRGAEIAARTRAAGLSDNWAVTLFRSIDAAIGEPAAEPDTGTADDQIEPDVVERKEGRS